MKGILVYWVSDGVNRMRALRLTFCADEDRGAIPQIRRQRIARILLEADHQGAKLNYRDLSMIMLSSKATLKRDMSYLRKHGQALGIAEKCGAFTAPLASGILPFGAGSCPGAPGSQIHGLPFKEK